MPRTDLIDQKLAHVRTMVRDLRNGEQAIARVGGFTVTTKGEEMKFQEQREAGLLWARAASDRQIETKLRQLAQRLTPEERACKYGAVRGLPYERVKLLAFIEDLEIALGVHPAVRR